MKSSVAVWRQIPKTSVIWTCRYISLDFSIFEAGKNTYTKAIFLMGDCTYIWLPKVRNIGLKLSTSLIFKTSFSFHFFLPSLFFFLPSYFSPPFLSFFLLSFLLFPPSSLLSSLSFYHSYLKLFRKGVFYHIQRLKMGYWKEILVF